MKQTGENGEEPNFGPNFDPFGPNLGFQNFFQLLVVRKCSELSSYVIFGKTKNQTSENSEKPNFGPDYGPFDPNLGPPFFFVDFTSGSC